MIKRMNGFNSNMRTVLIIAVIAAAVLAGFLSYTAPGHRLLYKGVTAACGVSDNC